MTDSSQPFAAKKFLEIKGRRMAYIDQGEGAPSGFAHGNPTSSYLGRNVMPACRGLGPAGCLRHDRNGRFRETSRLGPRSPSSPVFFSRSGKSWVLIRMSYLSSTIGVPS